MNFEKESGAYGNSKSEISEMISGSHQITQSRAPNKSKPPVRQQPIIEEEQAENQHHNLQE